MPDVLAAIGLVELNRYESEILPERRRIVQQYENAFSKYSWAQLHTHQNENQNSSAHLYLLRIKKMKQKN